MNNNATNGQIAEVREWLEGIFPLNYRLTSEELDVVAAELAHKIYAPKKD